VRSRLAAAAVVLAAVPLLAGCDSGTTGATEGDCNVRLLLDGVSYRVNSDLRQDPPRGTMLGRAEQRGCGGSALPGAPTQRVWSIDGVDPAVAISTGPARAPSVYVVEGSTSGDWPAVLRRH
jgi:hypothetical protein